MGLREFFIEDRLEKFRTEALCNLGESGIRNLDLGQLAEYLNLDLRELGKLSLADSPNSGRKDLREEISKLYTNVSPDQVLVTTGTGEALFIAFHLLLQKGDITSLFWPAFQALYEVPRSLGANLQKVDLLPRLEGKELGFGKENLNKLFKNSPQLIVFNHPHNPTGIIAEEEDKKELQKLSANFPNWILFDEHYRFLSEEEDLGWSGFGICENSVSTGSITKCFGVMGLRIGWLIGPKEWIQKARSMKDYLTHTVSPISEFLTLKLLQNRKTLQSKIRETLCGNIRTFAHAVEGELPGITSFKVPRGGVVGFAKLQPGLDSKKFADFLYEKAGVFVLPSADFETEGYIRLGFGETEERFRLGLARWSNLGLELIALLNK
ncbi:aminotransferase class I/II-fold pyridoxal phosphate-dependent enzyme [Leptospira selangorensis]|uniref:Aminotransferase n=1 Tax=Leptospira selangorensis TaxID=2484982 RepID=A0A5F2C406_9LEPT|nr:aminotransferase class I/II-fold pyridoxal phosphate-dependent enzyme [Leptospira selangorensis]TGM11287.1 aminotransferase class I/II-fold pyridoxal phosphate-dependent enzyme [Leptospira selangorensis]TGM22961.1 aminotransferase class I/II-fold pyridoxal phosphate-dependent enzyme [Leptospira selangorensis]